MNRANDNFYRPPQSHLSSDEAKSRISVFRVARFWGFIFASPIVVSTIYYACYYYYSISTSLQTSNTPKLTHAIRLLASLILLAISIFFSAYSLAWKRPITRFGHLCHALIFSILWVAIYHLTSIILYLIFSITVPALPLLSILFGDLISIIFFFFYSFLLIWVIQWRFKVFSLTHSAA